MSASEPDHFDSQSEGPQSVRGCCMRQPGGCHVAPEQEWKFPVVAPGARIGDSQWGATVMASNRRERVRPSHSSVATCQ